uniref:F-box and leucine rich repeat protein 6 n=1 Tax=Poecilia reticulata TaxID=8081 RepID=A0A3P9PJF6_POERE
MDASAQSGGTGGGGTGGGATGGRGTGGRGTGGRGTARKPAPKRKEGGKARKAKKARVSRPAFTIQQGEDMLLYISNTSSQAEGSLWTSRRKTVSKAKLLKNQKKKKKTVCPKSRLERKTVKEEEEDRLPEEDRWGQLLPEEVLVSIFQMLVVQDGAVPFLCRVSRVCRLWNAAAATLTLWRKVAVNHCWIQPARGQTEKTSNRIKETFTWLAENRFSQLRDFTLCHWATSVDFALQTVSEFCPQLRSVHLSYCRGVTGSGLRSLGLRSRSLQRLNLQHSEFQVEGLVDFLEEHGKQIRQMLFTRSHRNDKVLAAIAIFRMFNIQIQHKAMRKRGESEAGFPLLDEFCIANTEYSYMTDQVLLDVLFGSTRLRVLDLRGSTRITTFGLAQLPCPKLECLFWGQYFTKNIGFTSVKKNLQLLMEKWGPTLQQLDITNQPFTEADLQVALAFLAQVAEADTLLSLNLSGTKITAQALRPVVERMTALGYLNLSSCRNLPRGVKKIYRSQEEIQELLANLH